MKKTLQVIVALIVIVMLLMSIVPFMPTGDAAVSIRAYANDTIAGMDGSFYVPSLKAGQQIFLEVEREDGVKMLISTSADQDGVAEYTLEGKYLTLAGEYQVAVKNSKSALPGPFTKFEVYPQELDLRNVVVEQNKEVVEADGQDSAVIAVTLRDKYLNPVPYHQLQLISTKKSDVVASSDDRYFTDETGSVTFEVSSQEPGLSNLYAFDATANKLVAESIKVEFNGDIAPLAYGGDDETYAAFEDYSEDDFVYTLSEDGLKYVFPNFPDQVKVGEPFSFTIEIQSATNEKEENYLGTVHFSVPGAEIGDVILPVDYQFTEDDQGSHTFPLSLQFQKEGSYKLVVQDADDEEMLTEQNVVVGSGEGASLFHGAAGSKVQITEPKSGTYSTPSQVIQGKAGPGLIVKIYDNDKEIASVNSDIQGKFTYTTPALSEGKHTLYGVSVSNSGEIISVSDDVNITIDVSGPAVKNVKVEPSSGLSPEQAVSVEFVAEESLSQVIIKFEGENIEMQPVEGKPNTYKSTFKAPKEFGTYPLSLLLVDSLGNQTENENVAQVIVGSGNGAEFVAAVPRVEAYPSDGKITLMWEKPSSTLPIKNYRIYYGDSPQLLNQIVDTSKADTTWYIPNLLNGKEFFFAVTALDEKGNESAQKSPVVSAKPFATTTVKPKDVEVKPVDPNLVNESPDVQGDTGPEILWLALASILAANFCFRKRSALCKKGR